LKERRVSKTTEGGHQAKSDLLQRVGRRVGASSKRNALEERPSRARGWQQKGGEGEQSLTRQILTIEKKSPLSTQKKR